MRALCLRAILATNHIFHAFGMVHFPNPLSQTMNPTSNIIARKAGNAFELLRVTKTLLGYMRKMSFVICKRQKSKIPTKLLELEKFSLKTKTPLALCCLSAFGTMTAGDENFRGSSRRGRFYFHTNHAHGDNIHFSPRL